LHPGMNQFLWNLRYPDATDVNGVLWSVNGASEPVGPEVPPGTYYVQLSYGGATTPKRAFTVTLDPRLHASQAALEQRFDLMMRIYKAENELDGTLNQALALRDKLAPTSAAYTSLNDAIGGLVELRIQSSEGGLMFRARLHAWLTNIGQQVDQEFEAPTPAMVQVADLYIQEADAGAALLRAAMARAGR
ncbi:MAG: hypothetical protein ACRD2H_07070, partial [Terriglobales bacterium]